MDLFWIGVALGTGFAYVGHRVRERERRKIDDSRKRRLVRTVFYVFAGWIVLVALTQSAAMYAMIEIDPLRVPVVFLSRALAPFMVGLGGGATLFYFGVRLFHRHRAALSVTDAASFGILSLVVILIARDPTLTFLNYLSKANIQGIEFDFGRKRDDKGNSGVTNVPGIQQFSQGLQPDTEKVDTANTLLGNISASLQKDIEYANENHVGNSKRGFQIEADLKLESKIYLKVLKPIMERIEKIREIVPWSYTVVDNNIDLIESLRMLILYKTPDEGYVSVFDNFIEKFDLKITRVCETSLRLKESEDDYRTDAIECLHSKLAATSILRGIFKSSAESRQLIFSRDHVYGTLTVALLYLAVHADDAALAVLDRWISMEFPKFAKINAKPEPREKSHPYELFRALVYQQIIQSMQDMRIATNRQVYLKGSARIHYVGFEIINGGSWSEYLSIIERYSKDNTEYSRSAILNAKSKCAKNISPLFRRFMTSLISSDNDAAFYAVDEFNASSEQLAVARERIDRISTMNLACIQTEDFEKSDIPKTHAAILDTKVVVYLSLAKQAYSTDTELARVFACKAMQTATRAAKISEIAGILEKEDKEKTVKAKDPDKKPETLRDIDIQQALESRSKLIAKQRSEEASAVFSQVGGTSCPQPN